MIRVVLPRRASSGRVRLAAQSLTLAIAMGGIATLSILVFRGPLRALRDIQLPPSASRLTSVTADASSERKPRNMLRDQALVKVPHEPEVSKKTRSLPALDRHLSPGELFALANQARDQGDLSDATARAQQLLQLFPSSPEGVKAHLLLGLIYLDQGESNQALGELATYRHIGNPETLAEALWAQAQALRQLARVSDEREVILELLKSYPRSVYVAAAKERLNALPSGAP